MKQYRFYCRVRFSLIGFIVLFLIGVVCPAVEEDEGLAPSLNNLLKNEDEPSYAIHEQAAWEQFEGSGGRVQNVAKAIELFQSLSDLGVPSAQFAIGLLHATGLGGFNASQDKALTYYTAAALSGHRLATMALGYRFWTGQSVEADCEHATAYYFQAATRVIQKQSLLGGATVYRFRLHDEIENFNGGNEIDPEFLQYYQYLADKGDSAAQANLGLIYLNGRHGAELNYDSAAEYFELASEGESANADAHLGRMYLEGTDATPQDDRKAFEYFRQAAKKGSAIGQCGLGLMYLSGVFLQEDVQQARSYFAKAAEQGNAEAQLQLGNMLFKGHGLPKSYKQAIKYYNLASQQGNLMAYYNLGQMYSNGVGTQRSCRIGCEFFKNVAERGKWATLFNDAFQDYIDGNYNKALVKYAILGELGYEVAQSNLAFMYEREEGNLFPKNEAVNRAFFYWQRAAHQGYSSARIKLGDFYYYGQGTSINFEAAANEYRLAVDNQNNAQAMFNLGYMHERGLGIKKDIYLAKRYYDLAMDTSADAFVPVTLALVKLSLLFVWEGVKSNYLYQMSPDLKQHFGDYWDIGLICIIIGVLSVLWYSMRRR